VDQGELTEHQSVSGMPQTGALTCERPPWLLTVKHWDGTDEREIEGLVWISHSQVSLAG